MAAAGAVVVTVMVPVTMLFGPLPVIEVGVQAAPAGKPVQVTAIVVVKPVEAIMPRVVAPDPPGAAMVTLARPETAVKPGWIVKATGCELLLLLKLASPA